MKANELMLGDYVSTPKGIFRVTAIQDNDVIFTDYADDITGAVDIEDVHPVPLTEEIIEKNGFTRYSVVHFNLQQWVLNEGNGCRVSLYQDVKSGKWVIKDFWIDCIHELQHILRLCKIEKEIML